MKAWTKSPRCHHIALDNTFTGKVRPGPATVHSYSQVIPPLPHDHNICYFCSYLLYPNKSTSFIFFTHATLDLRFLAISISFFSWNTHSRLLKGFPCYLLQIMAHASLRPSWVREGKIKHECQGFTQVQPKTNSDIMGVHCFKEHGYRILD